MLTEPSTGVAAAGLRAWLKLCVLTGVVEMSWRKEPRRRKYYRCLRMNDPEPPHRFELVRRAKRHDLQVEVELAGDAAESAKHKLTLLQLAEELGNVSQACHIMGCHRETFYKVRRAFKVGGLAALGEKKRGPRGPHPNRLAPEIEQQILALCLERPTWGAPRIAGELVPRITAGSRHLLPVNAQGRRQDLRAALLQSPRKKETAARRSNEAKTDPKTGRLITSRRPRGWVNTKRVQPYYIPVFQVLSSFNLPPYRSRGVFQTFARKHVSMIPVRIGPAPRPSQKPESITRRSRAVRTAPQNAIRDKTDKKAVRPASPYQFERFLRLGLSFRILVFRWGLYTKVSMPSVISGICVATDRAAWLPQRCAGTLPPV